MTDLEWRKTPEGYENDEYRIRRLEGWPRPRWRLEASDTVTAQQGSRPLTMSIHRTLRDAKRRAGRDEQDRIRRARVTGHVVVGIAASLIAAALSPFIDTIPGFVAFLVFLFVALRSLADAAGVWLGDAWGWPRDRGAPEKITWSGRRVLALMEAMRRRRLASARAEAEPAILMLPPEPPQ